MNIPRQIPAMTLKDVVLFPNAIMPLRIFEKRYRLMLSEVLKSDRMFAVVAQRDKVGTDEQIDEPPFEVATAGLIRVSKTNTDGTSLVMLEGISRVRIESIANETPYRVLNIQPFDTIVDNEKPVPRNDILEAMRQNHMLGGEVTKEILDYVSRVKDDSAFVDLVAYALCHRTIRKQAMLEIQRLHKRAEMLLNDILSINMQLSIQGSLPESDLGKNIERN